MPLAKDALWHSSFADWSPDGHFVAVDVFPEASAAPGIYVVNLRDKSISLLPGSEAFTYPRWSPDGRYIATRSVDEKKVFLYDTQLRRWRPILTGNLISRYEWDRNSQSLFFQDMLDPRETVFRFDVQTGVVRRVMDFNKALNNGAVRCAFEGFARRLSARLHPQQ